MLIQKKIQFLKIWTEFFTYFLSPREVNFCQNNFTNMLLGLLCLCKRWMHFFHNCRRPSNHFTGNFAQNPKIIVILQPFLEILCRIVSFGHVECSSNNPAKTISLKFRNLFARGLTKTTRIFLFLPKFFWKIKIQILQYWGKGFATRSMLFARGQKSCELIAENFFTKEFLLIRRK